MGLGCFGLQSHQMTQAPGTKCIVCVLFRRTMQKFQIKKGDFGHWTLKNMTG